MEELFSNDGAKQFDNPNLDQPVKQSYYFDTVYLYLFLLTLCLNPDFYCCENAELSWVNEVANGKLCFVLAITNILVRIAAKITQFQHQVDTR